MTKNLLLATVILGFVALTGCAGGSAGVYYGYPYGRASWGYHGGYYRDRVHVVSEDEIRALDAIDAVETERALEFSGPAMDMGFGGDMGFDGGGFDGGGFDF